MRAAFLLALAGTAIAVVVTTTTYVLGALAGLAQNPAGVETIRDSSRLLVASGLAVVGCILLRRHPPAGVVCLALAGGGGFLVGNPLWIFAAMPLLGAALLVTAMSRQGKDRVRRP
jgi:hypothetical protein